MCQWRVCNEHFSFPKLHRHLKGNKWKFKPWQSVSVIIMIIMMMMIMMCSGDEGAELCNIWFIFILMKTLRAVQAFIQNSKSFSNNPHQLFFQADVYSVKMKSFIGLTESHFSDSGLKHSAVCVILPRSVSCCWVSDEQTAETLTLRHLFAVTTRRASRFHPAGKRSRNVTRRKGAIMTSAAEERGRNT